MDVFSPKERLLRVLRREGADRPPVICPGGMMNAAIVEVMEKNGGASAAALPAAHHEGGLMGDLARDVCEQTGFENFGLPFCMTIEAEALGSEVDYGSLTCEPKIRREVFSSVGEVREQPPGAIAKNRRAEAVINAVHRLSRQFPDIPVIGSLTGPLSAAASIVDPMTFLKELRREKAAAHRVLDYVSDQLIDYVKLVAENGASAISIADPTATGEILGPKLFGEYAVPCINRIVDAVHALGLPVIVHICGELRMVQARLSGLRGDTLSVDAFVNLGSLKKEAGIENTMGNLSTYMLEFGSPERVRDAV
ncbi:MAG: methylcobamide--CoM methyltransferase, partial [Treponema sp.]|nr:methylcobamide--CoM methyltransferase [Treponema sp.]